MSKDTTMMSKLKQAEELVRKAVKEWNKGEPDKDAAYNDHLRKARHLIFEVKRGIYDE